MKAKRKADGRYRTTREAYKTAKQFDHTQFDDFCTAIYAEGVKDGKSAVPAVGIQEVMAAVKTVKGLGEKRLTLIEAAIAGVFPNRTEAVAALVEQEARIK